MENQTTESTVVPVISTETAETMEPSTRPVIDHPKTGETSEQSSSPVTNMPVSETSQPPELRNTHETAPSVSVHNNLITSEEKYQGWEMRQETAEEKEVRSVLQVIAATGKFWCDWETLRSMLSLHLMQVISEYPQAKMTVEEQRTSLGETHAELANRLRDALHSFVDGPPFTLQRLSEIILDAQILYPNLSKLALALEKNLSVTSTLTVSTDPCPSSLITTSNGLNKVTEVPNPNPNPQLQSDTVMENGTTPVAVAADRDEIMTEAEADVSDVMEVDVEMAEKPSVSSPTGLSKL